MQLPKPDLASQQHSEKVRAFIANKIQTNGPIPFNEYMQLVLYAPGLGYYAAGTHKLGVGGDFVTAPELSPLFSWCIARQCKEVLTELVKPEILEVGAGTGKMALEILYELQRLNCLPERYVILEVSADLKARQQQLFRERAPEFLDRVHWLDELPKQPFVGIVLANEVIDAMPVHRFKINNGIKEFYVGLDDDKFIWQLKAPSCRELTSKIQMFELAEGYCSEINLLLSPWLQSLAASLSSGVVLLIDYGYVQTEYFHPERSMGTLLCHYQHYAHDDPFKFPGIQDITASVDFTAVAEAAVNAGFDVQGFLHQAGFLVNLGITDFLSRYTTDLQYYDAAQQVKRLTLPSEMGERFKVLALAKEFSEPLRGFEHFDQIVTL